MRQMCTRIVAFEVSNSGLTVHSLPDGQQVIIPNTDVAVTKLLKARAKLCSGLVVCEASGGDERLTLNGCVALGLSVHRA